MEPAAGPKYPARLVDSISKVHKLLADHGPVFKETLNANLHHTIVEPWNGISSLALLIPVFYWLYKLRGSYKDYPFIMFTLPVLFISGISSTLFHLFRMSRFLLFMDAYPALILILMVSVYFWYRVLPKIWQIFLIEMLFIAFQYLFRKHYNNAAGKNVSFFIDGMDIFVPALMLLEKTQNAFVKWLFYAVVYFFIGLIFRHADMHYLDFIPFGTHWLWHLFCSAGIFCLSTYFVKITRRNKEFIITEG